MKKDDSMNWNVVCYYPNMFVRNNVD